MLLVTGATGFLGSNVMKAIAGPERHGKGTIILAPDYENARKMYPKYRIIRGDITRPGMLDELKKAAKDIDTVIHLAGMVSYTQPKDALFEVNVEGTRAVLEACPHAKKIIFSSSVSVYGEITGMADESYPLSPENFYGWSKLEAEKLIADAGVRSVIFRIAPIYGAGSPQWLKNLKLLEKGFPIPNTENLTHVTHISNAVQAFRLALKPKASGLYNIADEKPVKFTEFASELVRLLGRQPKVMPYWLVSLAAGMRGMGTYLKVLTMNRNYDVTKAEKEMGYKPEVDFESELKKMIEWYRQTKQKTKEKG